MKKQPAILMLDDGTSFSGHAYGARQDAAGEVVFTTGMTGYQETLTDPSYHGQIVSFTTAHMANYGNSPMDDESSKPQAAGVVTHDWFAPECPNGFPHWRADSSFDERLAKAGLTVIAGVDTRALTLHLRKHGARNGVIGVSTLDKDTLLARAKALPSMAGQDFAQKVSCTQSYDFVDSSEDLPQRNKKDISDTRRFKVAVYDFGVKRAILRHLQAVGLDPTVWPATTPAETVLASNPDGIFLSNGPGDPEPCRYAVKAIKQFLGKLPVFGICLGHQLLARALGGTTYKLKFGHHGINHPVKDMDTGKVCITSQNHGFNVDPESLGDIVEFTHWNLNDQTLEGMRCKNLPAFSVQFHPEAAAGPHDAENLFVRFRTMIEAFPK